MRRLFSNLRFPDFVGLPAMANALLLENGIVLAVGAAREIRPHLGEFVEHDGGGNTVLPAFCDSHLHVLGFGVQQNQIDLLGCTNMAQIRERVAQGLTRKNSLARRGDWILGRGWDQNLFAPPEFPSAADLDALCPNQPAYFKRVDGHAAWINSTALKICGITEGSPDPEGGKILRDRDGQPTGILIDRAMVIVERKIPALTREHTKISILAALTYFQSLGLRTVHEMGVDARTLDVYAELSREKRLPVSVVGFGEALAMNVRDLPPRKLSAIGEKFHWAGMKFYMDGALGSRGAWLSEPYADAPGQCGFPLQAPEELFGQFEKSAQLGYSIATHAIGDKGVETVLRLYRRLRQRGFENVLRIEHASVVRDEQLPEFAELNVVPVMQPGFYPSDKSWLLARLGKSREKWIYRWKSMLNNLNAAQTAENSGLPLSSDAPIEDPNPLHGIRQALCRDDGEQLSLKAAVEGYSRAGHLLTQKLCAAKTGEWKWPWEKGSSTPFALVENWARIGQMDSPLPPVVPRRV